MEPGEQTYHFGGRRWRRPGYAALAEEIGRIEVATLAARAHCERLLRDHLPDRGLRGIATDDELAALSEVLTGIDRVLAAGRGALEPLRDRYSEPDPPS